MADGTKPAIIRYGAGMIRDYSIAEFEIALARGFAANPDAGLILDSFPNGQRFLAACAAWAIGEGLLYVAQVADDGQNEVCALRLTDAGKARFSVRAEP